MVHGRACPYENKPGFLSSHVFFLDFVPPLDEDSPRVVSCRAPSSCHDLFTNVDKRCWILALGTGGSGAWREGKIYKMDKITEFEKDVSMYGLI